jgi:hypothetical protein
MTVKNRRADLKKRKKTKEPLPTKIPEYETPIPFEETFKYVSSITFTADSYMKWIREALPLIKGMKVAKIGSSHDHNRKIGVQLGDDKIFYLRELPIYYYDYRYFFSDIKDRVARSSLYIVRSNSEGHVKFDDSVIIPVLANNNFKPWMSLTPNEVLTQRGAIRRAKGDVGMAGLGMGWAARKVLQRTKVKHLTIYEVEQPIIDFFGKSLLEDFGDRVSIVKADAYEVDWMQYDVALWDIWIEFGNANGDTKYEAIRDNMKANGKVCVGWGEGYSGSSSSRFF